MVIHITSQDIWREFVHYRKLGFANIAFAHLRVRETKPYFEAILSGIAYRNYNPQFGDIITAGPDTPYSFMWDYETERAFYGLKTDLFPANLTKATRCKTLIQ